MVSGNDAIPQNVGTVSGNDVLLNAAMNETVVMTDPEMTYTDELGNLFTYEVDEEGNATITGIAVSGAALTILASINDIHVVAVANGSSCVVTNTYSWITAMLFSITFMLLYRKGKERMEKEGLTSQELKVPVKCLIDECRNIGKIPNLGEYLATCRKYQIAICPIFQNYSQIVEVYGKEGANSIIGNCDTTIFLGGSDSDTLKIIVERMGKDE